MARGMAGFAVAALLWYLLIGGLLRELYPGNVGVLLATCATALGHLVALPLLALVADRARRRRIGILVSLLLTLVFAIARIWIVVAEGERWMPFGIPAYLGGNYPAPSFPQLVVELFVALLFWLVFAGGLAVARQIAGRPLTLVTAYAEQSTVDNSSASAEKR